MIRGAIGLLAIGALPFLLSSSDSVSRSPSTHGTCVTQLIAAPLKLDSLFLLGDSIANSSSFKSGLRAHLKFRDMIFSGQRTVSGIGVEQAIDLLYTEIEHSDIEASDVILTNLGVNNWNQAITKMPTVEILIDTFIADIKAINNDILILWQEPYGHLPLVSKPDIAVGAAMVAKYLRTKDEAGDVCLIPWGEFAAADPVAYTDVAHPDGVHIWGNENIYQEITFNYIDSLRGKF